MHRKFASCRQRLSWKAALVFIAIFGSLNYCIVPHHGSSEREKIPKATKSKTSTLRADGINSPILSSGRRLKPSIRAIPEKHWQSWKVDIAEFSQQEWDQMRTWREKNPFHRYELLSDDSAETFVQQSFYDEPEIIRNYLSLTDPILRADILRYLILYAEGGVWSDIDTKALKPVRDWIPTQYWNQFNVVIGLEIDEPGVMWLDWADNFVLCQSTMMASAGHRIYHTLIHNIIETLDALAYRQSTRLEALQLSFQDVLRITGPVAFTRVVLDYITEAAGENITRANLSGITEPKLVADVLFLPVVAFVPGQSHSNSGHSEDEAALVQHIGLGSWRETHAFDRVEYGR
jgi:mannosyltransferase OCH1-like enzyme